MDEVEQHGRVVLSSSGIHRCISVLKHVINSVVAYGDSI